MSMQSESCYVAVLDVNDCLTKKAKLLSFACALSDYKDYYTDTTVKFVLSLTEDKLAEAEQGGLHKKFKLEGAINTSNMVSQLC